MPRLTMTMFCVTLINIVFLGGCAGTWSTGQISNVRPESTPHKTVSPDSILIVEGDITDRGYVSLGDISVTINKTTLLHADPTKEAVDAKLQDEAAKLGANAVILVRYGTVGVSLMSWGSLNGKGRAIVFSR